MYRILASFQLWGTLQLIGLHVQKAVNAWNQNMSMFRFNQISFCRHFKLPRLPPA